MPLWNAWAVNASPDPTDDYTSGESRLLSRAGLQSS